MNEQELSALLDELISEQTAKQSAAQQKAVLAKAAAAEHPKVHEHTKEVPKKPEVIPERTEHISKESEVQPEQPANIPDMMPNEPELPSDHRKLHEITADPEISAQLAPQVSDDLPQSAEKPAAERCDLPDEQPRPAPKAAARSDHRGRDTAVGLILVLLAAIGLYSLVRGGIGLGKQLLSDQQQKTAVAECILPLVLMDIPDFESPDALSDDQFLTAAIWGLAADGSLAGYPESFEMCTVPAADVIAAGNARFGTERMPECRTIGFTSDLRFYYDAEQGSFLLPADPRLFTFVPEIGTISADAEGVYHVEAAYRAEQPSWKQDSTAQIVKTVEYTMIRNGDVWQIQAAKQIS